MRLTLGTLLVVVAVAFATVGSGDAAQSRVPTGYSLVTVLRGVHDSAFWNGRETTVGDGGGLVRSDEVGVGLTGRRTRLSCRLSSVDRTGKAPFQSDPVGACDVYFPSKQVITVRELPDLRSKAFGWETGGVRVVEPPCETVVVQGFPGCFTHSTKLELVVKGHGVLKPGFALKQFALSVNNPDPAFGLVEDHGQQQVSVRPLLCGTVQAPQKENCSALYEYGTKVVLDAQWDITRSLTVSWDGCDPAVPGSPPTNDQLCPVTLTSNRTVTIFWH